MNRRHFLATIVSAAAAVAARRPKPELLPVGVYADWPGVSNPLFAATYDYGSPLHPFWDSRVHLPLT